jgi:hypothetical protein
MGMRHIRFVPENGSLVEVTIRTFQSNFLWADQGADPP